MSSLDLPPPPSIKKILFEKKGPYIGSLLVRIFFCGPFMPSSLHLFIHFYTLVSISCRLFDKTHRLFAIMKPIFCENVSETTEKGKDG